MNLTPTSLVSHPSFGWVGLPVLGGSEFSAYTCVRDLPVCGSPAAYPRQPTRKRWGLASSCRFSPHMPRSRTSAVPRESHHYDSSVWASVTLTTSPTAFILLTMLTASGICVSPVAYVVLCVRFVSLVRVCRSLNRLQRSAGHATLDTGGWLDLMKTILCLPVRDFHPERNGKLRLPH